jgi:hypothetical protein
MNSTWWRRFFSSAAGASHAAPAPALINDVDNPPDRVEATGISPLMFKPLLQMSEGLPRPDWDMVTAWIASIPDHSEQAAAWGRCEIAWLQHLQSALGQRYRLRMADEVALLSTLDDVTAKATLAFVARSRERIARTLAGLAQVPEWGYDIVLVLDDEDTYYRYASHHYPDEGEFAFSSGMYLGGACGHFITVKNQLQSIEPTIVHELTHALLGHLPIPAWLNEGLAVNTEHRFYRPSSARTGVGTMQRFNMRVIRNSGALPKSSNSGRATRLTAPTRATNCPMTWPASSPHSSPPTGNASRHLRWRPTTLTVERKRPGNGWASA